MSWNKFKSLLCLALFVVPWGHSAVLAQEDGAGTYTHRISVEDRAKRLAREQELAKKLADKHGYKLAKDEPLRYIPESSIPERDKLGSKTSHATSVSEWMNQPRGKQPESQTYEPFMLIFCQQPGGSLAKSRQIDGIITLAEVLDQVLSIKRQEFECPASLLMTYVPGDWVLSWDPRDWHELSDTDLAVFERILNEKFNLGVKVGWKTVEKPALVMTGKYRANPQSEEDVIESPDADGSFGLLARRTHLAGTGGSYEQFKAAIGEALMLPVVDETVVRPKKSYLAWFQSGEPVMNSDRLPPEQEQLVIDSLHQQMGYKFTIEPREVKLLSIEQVEP
jgi:hypothetical protein